MLSTFYLSAFIIILIIIIVIHHAKKRSRHPPGPLGLPFVGMFPFQIIQIVFAKYLPRVSHLKMFRKMKEKYGDYWSMEMGGQRIVTLASLDLVNEAFLNTGFLFSGRPRNEVFDKISDCQGIMLADGTLWRENRHMGIKALKEFGMGKREMENHIIEEGNMLIEYLLTIASRPIDSSVSFIKAFSNVISRLVFNEFNEYGDPDLAKFVMDLRCALVSEVIDTKCNLFPKFFVTKLARIIFPDVDKYFTAWEDIRIFLSKKCEKKKAIQNITIEPTCVFDHFWRYRYQYEPEIKEDQRFYEIFHCMSDLYMAGTETTNTLMGYCVLMLGQFEEAQQEIRSEILTLTDDYRYINMNMKKDCPRLLSFIDEVERYCCLVATFPRRVMKPFTLRGYELYPSDIIIGDFGTISRENTLFKNPNVFDPYRFLDESRKKYTPSPFMVPFGVGKRACMGEGIANMELFLFFARIVLSFKISLPVETLKNLDDIVDGRSGFVHGPLDHEIIFNPF